MSFKHWTDENHKDLLKSSTYKELLSIALDVLGRMPQPIGQVCGPISTGGAGSIEENLKAFDNTIRKLQESGHNVFNQMPFEEPMQIIKESRESEGYDDSLLEDFYLPIFESGLVHRLFFMPDWQSSYGAKWEHQQGKKLGLEIVYL